VFYHDSAAALISDGEIVAAAQEERFTRKKHDSGFPRQHFSNHGIGFFERKLIHAAVSEQPGKVYLHQSGWRSIRVPGISLRTILKKLDRVDLIDLDIEGQELITLTAAVAGLDAKVKRLHIGTHSAEIEAGLRRLLSDHGWRCLVDYPLLKTSETPFGVISFGNGVQSWVNPRL